MKKYLSKPSVIVAIFAVTVAATITGISVTRNAVASIPSDAPQVGSRISGNADMSIDVQLTADAPTVDYTVNINGTESNPHIVDGGGHVRKCVKVLASFVIVQNFVVENCAGHALFNRGHDNILRFNIVKHNSTENGTNGLCNKKSGGWPSGIKNEFGSSYTTVVGNTVYENCGEGIGNTMSPYNLITENTVYDNFSFNIYVDNSFSVVVYNNNVYNTQQSGYRRNGEVARCFGIGEEDYSSSFPGWGGNRLNDVWIIYNVGNGCHEGITMGPPEQGTSNITQIVMRGNTLLNGNWIPIAVSRTGLCPWLEIKNNVIWKNQIYIKCSGATIAGNVLPNTTPAPATNTVIPTSLTMTSTVIIPTASHTPIKSVTPLPASLTPSATVTLTVTATPTMTATPTRVPTVTPRWFLCKTYPNSMSCRKVTPIP